MPIAQKTIKKSLLKYNEIFSLPIDTIIASRLPFRFNHFIFRNTIPYYCCQIILFLPFLKPQIVKNQDYCINLPEKNLILPFLCVQE